MGCCVSCCFRPKMCEVTRRPPNGESFKVVLCETEEEFERLTIQDLWTKISEFTEEDYSPDRWSLNFRDRSFYHGNSLLSEVGIKPRSVIRTERKRGLEWDDLFYASGQEYPVPGQIIVCSIKFTSMDRLDDFNSPILTSEPPVMELGNKS